jgi:hypothetical protein
MNWWGALVDAECLREFAYTLRLDTDHFRGTVQKTISPPITLR